MDSQFFMDAKLHFNLRSRKKSKPTIIYAVISIKNKQYKINCGVKVYSKHWVNRYQICLQSPLITQLDNNNNRIANDRLDAVRLAFKEFKLYFCQNPNILNNGLIRDTIKSYIANNMKINKHLKTIDTGTYILKCAFEKYYNEGQKESTKRVNYVRLERFTEFVKDKNIDNTIQCILSQKTLDCYRNYLVNLKKEAKYINQLCSLIVRLTNDIFCKKSDYKKYSITRLEYDLIKNKLKHDDTKKVPLTEQEIEYLVNLELDEKESEYRDLFVLQCAVGQRISDMPKLFSREIQVVENGFVIVTKKEDISATILQFNFVKDMLEKYRNGFKYINIEEWDNNVLSTNSNKMLKTIFKKAGLNRSIEWREQKGFDVVNKKDELCNIISTHYARHTFITNMYKGGMPVDTLCYLTGHKDDKMIREVYNHLTKEDKAKLATNAFVNKVDSRKISKIYENNFTTNNELSNDLDSNIIVKLSKKNLLLEQNNELYKSENYSLKSDLERMEYDEYLESGEPDIPCEDDFLAFTTDGNKISIKDAEEQITNKVEKD